MYLSFGGLEMIEGDLKIIAVLPNNSLIFFQIFPTTLNFTQFLLDTPLITYPILS